MTPETRAVDFLVCGAGPAGCAAAAAARRVAPTLRIAVIDRARFPREKICGGAITGGGLRELERAGLELRVLHARATHARLTVDGASHRVALPVPAAVVRRERFDADLVRQVRALGVEVIEDAALKDLSLALAITSAGTFAFRALVCADGVAGPSRRLLGLPAGRRIALRESLVHPGRQEDLVFDLDAEGCGYAWRFPCLDDAGVGESVGVYRPVMELRAGASRTSAPPDLSGAAARWSGAQGLLPAEIHAWSIRSAVAGGPVGVDRALLAGEALGVDPLTGEGIRYALWSGRIAGQLAAHALLRGRQPSLREYHARLALSSSGLALAAAIRLAPRLYGKDRGRYRGLAVRRSIAAMMAAVVSGEPVVAALLHHLLGSAPVRATD